jgi:peptide/nickel transport system substrate-binding protein
MRVQFAVSCDESEDIMQIRTFLLRVIIAGVVAAAPAAASAQGKPNLTIALAANVNTLDPHKSATVGTDLSVISHLYTPLVIRGPDLKLQPAAAASWKAVNDLTWRFELRPNLTFPDGEKLDAAAVKWNVDRVLDPKTAARIKPWFDPIKEVRVVGPNTVEMVTKEPYPALADQMSMFFLLPPKWAAQNNPATAAMGTGPYDLREFRSGDRIVLQAKANHFAGAPPFGTVTFRIIPEEASRVAALLAGEVDFVDGIGPSEIKRITATGKATAGAVPSTRVVIVKFNTLKPPFKGNVKLRQALNYAIDRQAINDSVLGGLGQPLACQVLTPAYFGFNPDLKPTPYDPKRAKQLLAEAGFPNGLTLEFEVPLGRYLLAQEISQAVAAYLGEVGVQTKIVEMEFGRWIDKYRNAGNMGQMSYIGQAWPTLDADGMLSLFEPGNGYAYYDNAEFGKLVAEARATTDRAKRLALYKKATDVMCNDPPHIHLFVQPYTFGISNRITWSKRGDDWVRAYDMRPK